MNCMFIRARYNYIQLIILQRIEGKAKFLYSLPFPPSSNGMKWFAVILILTILIAIPADANFLNGYALNGPVLVGYVLKIRIGGICIGGIRLRFLLMHTFWMDTHWMDTHSMDTYWWDTCWTDTYWWDTYCKTCWCKRFERITLHGYVLVGYVLNGYVLVGYVLVGYVLNGYVWDMCGVMDMCGICVVWDMCGICVVWDMCGICVAWDMCGICVVWDTPTIFWRSLRRNVFREKSVMILKENLLRKSEISQSLFCFKSVWTWLEIFRLAFQNVFSPLAGLKNRIKTGIGILQESARRWRVFWCVLFSTWLKSRFGWIFDRYVFIKKIFCRKFIKIFNFGK